MNIPLFFIISLSLTIYCDSLKLFMSSHNPLVTKQLDKCRKLILSSTLSFLMLNSNPIIANAGFFDSKEQNLINTIAEYQKPVNDVLDMLRPVDMPNAIGKSIKIALSHLLIRLNVNLLM